MSHSVSEMYDEAVFCLSKAQIPSPRLEARLMLLEALGLSADETVPFSASTGERQKVFLTQCWPNASVTFRSARYWAGKAFINMILL